VKGGRGGRGLAITFERFSSLRMNAPVCIASDDWVGVFFTGSCGCMAGTQATVVE
jgi:hypothetical protein